MKKSLIILILSLFLIIFGCNQIDEPTGDSNLNYCEQNSDCAITKYGINKCCEATCAVFAFNIETIENMKIWRELNCDFKKETNFTDNKWIDCTQSPYYEFAECNIGLIRGATVICKDNKCEVSYGKP